MQKVNIKFKDVEQVRQFVNVIDKFDASFDLGSGEENSRCKIHTLV